MNILVLLEWVSLSPTLFSQAEDIIMSESHTVKEKNMFRLLTGRLQLHRQPFYGQECIWEDRRHLSPALKLHQFSAFVNSHRTEQHHL